jgi:serine/threonine protein kinase
MTLVNRLAAALQDRYAIERELGRGGMATVYLARDLKHGRTVAIKVMDPHLGPVLGGERFVLEIRTAAQLNHPHILPVFDSGDADGLLYYVMPRVEGGSLRDRLGRGPPLSLVEATRIACQVADALGNAHSHGIIHRDIKPENILFANPGHTYVTDFGIAKALSGTSAMRLTRTGTIVGSPYYLSPEQASGTNEVDGRSDIYSLACILYEMLAGRPPFDSGNAMALLAGHLVGEPPSLRATRPDVPQPLERLVAAGLSKKPEDRPQTAFEFRTRLARFSELESVGAGSMTPIRPQGMSQLRPFATLAFVAAIGISVSTSLRSPPPAPAEADVLPRLTYVTLYPLLPTQDSIASRITSRLASLFDRWSDVRLGVPSDPGTRVRQEARLALSKAKASGDAYNLRGTVEARAPGIRLRLQMTAGSAGTARTTETTLDIAEDDWDTALIEAVHDVAFQDAKTIDSTYDFAAATSWTAYSAYLDGHDALTQGDYAAAEREFERAAELDPTFPQAVLWLGQVRHWIGTGIRGRIARCPGTGSLRSTERPAAATRARASAAAARPQASVPDL